MKTHGLALTVEYRPWANMKVRCLDKTHTSYPKYGGRGITVCDRWLNSFENFLQDMGPRPSPEHSLDRIDNNGNYEPLNCKWATRYEQCANTRRNLNITWNGETKNLQQWCRDLDINFNRAYTRFRKLKLPLHEVFHNGPLKEIRNGKSGKN